MMPCLACQASKVHDAELVHRERVPAECLAGREGEIAGAALVHSLGGLRLRALTPGLASVWMTSSARPLAFISCLG